MRREPSIGPHSAAWPSLTAYGVLFLMFHKNSRSSGWIWFNWWTSASAADLAFRSFSNFLGQSFAFRPLCGLKPDISPGAKWASAGLETFDLLKGAKQRRKSCGAGATAFRNIVAKLAFLEVFVLISLSFQKPFCTIALG